MGRELKRVALDFDWPLNEVWKDYLTPHEWKECPSCEGSGHNDNTRTLEQAWYPRQHDTPTDPVLHAIFEDNADFGHHLAQDECDHLVDSGRCVDLTSEWKLAKPDNERPEWIRKRNADGSKYYPSDTVINAWARDTLGHDAINRWICVEFRAKKLGFWGECAVCEGSGEFWESPEAEKAAKDWKQTEPPEGPGYQLWENVSEGSPVSKVYPNKESFIDYLIAEGHSREAAERFISLGSAPSMIMTTSADGERMIKSGIDSLED